MEVRKMKNEDRLRNLDAAKIKEIRALFMKQKLCEKRFKYVSLWLTEEQIDEKLSLLGSDNEKRLDLKCQLQFKQKNFI